MKNSLLARLKKLEASIAPVPSIEYRIGLLKLLPEDFVGERHIAIVKRGPPGENTPWCEFEERPGPPPPGQDDGVPRIYLSEDEINM